MQPGEELGTVAQCRLEILQASGGFSAGSLGGVDLGGQGLQFLGVARFDLFASCASGGEQALHFGDRPETPLLLLPEVGQFLFALGALFLVPAEVFEFLPLSPFVLPGIATGFVFGPVGGGIGGGQFLHATFSRAGEVPLGLELVGEQHEGLGELFQFGGETVAEIFAAGDGPFLGGGLLGQFAFQLFAEWSGLLGQFGGREF